MTDTAPRTRRGPPRWLLAVVVVIVALPLIGAVALKAMFPPERLRELAEPQIERRVARDVQLGDVRLKVFPNVAIRLSDVRVANPPGFSDEPAIDLTALDLRMELFPLLRREFRLSQVRLVGPDVRIEVAADGTSNFTGLLARDEAAAAGSNAPAGSRFDVDDLVVSEGRVELADARSGRVSGARVDGRLAVEPGDGAGGAMASTGAFAFGAPFVVADGLAGGTDTTWLPAANIDYRAMFEPGFRRVAVPRLEIRVAGLELSGDATSRVDTLSGDRSTRAQLASETFRVSELIQLLPPATLPDTVSLDGEARIEIRYDQATEPTVSGTVELADFRVETPGWGRVLDSVETTAAFTAEQVSAPSVRGELLGRPFRGRFEVSGLGDEPQLSGHLAGEFDLAGINDAREGPPIPVAGTAAVEIDVAGPARDLAAWTLTGPVRLSDVSYAAASLPQPATISAATVQLTGGGIRGESIPVRIGGSDVTLSFRADGLVRHALTPAARRGAAPAIEFTARSDRLARADLSRDAAGPGYVDLLKARLAGARVNGESPEAIAGERYRRPDLSGIRASGRVTVDEWVNPPASARDVSFRVDVADGVVDVSNVSGTVYGGQLSGGVSLDLTASPPFELEYDLRLRGAGAGSLLDRWTRLGSALSGVVDFDITGAAPLDEGLLPLTTALVADGSASFVDGRFESFGIIDALRSRLELDTTRVRGFDDLGGTFQIRDGAFVVRDWTIGAGNVRGSVSGSAGLGGSLALDVTLNVPPDVVRKLPFQGNDALGALVERATATGAGGPIPLQLTVGGTMRDPTIRLDGEALATTLRDRATDAGRQRLEQETRDRLEDAAGGLLDRLRGGRADTVPADTTAGPTTDGGHTP